MPLQRKRKLSDMDYEPPKSKKNKKKPPRIDFEIAPPVYNLADLIELGKTGTYYSNVNSLMLWDLQPHLEDLERMVGLVSLKETVFFQIIYYLQNMHTRSVDGEYLHTIIMGPPGHGKTEVAKIIGKIYQSLGILSKKANFKIAHRDDFVGEFLGSTALKTKKLLESCVGGVLFIDEVYSLAPRGRDNDSFSKEALDTLTAFLSEHKNDFCCIAAGYENDIRDCFFSMNKGLERRFPWVHKIETYSSADLAEILVRMVSQANWHLNCTNDQITKLIQNNKEFFKNAGGDIETFLSKVKMIHSRRVFSMDSDNRFVITHEDLTNTIEYLQKTMKKESTIPFGMYL